MSTMYKMIKRFAEKLSVLALIFLIVGCSSSKESQINSPYGSPAAGDFDYNSSEARGAQGALTPTLI